MKKKTTRKGIKRVTVVTKSGGSRIIEPKGETVKPENTESKENGKVS